MITGVWLSPDGTTLAVQMDGEMLFECDSERTTTLEEVGQVPGNYTTLYQEED